MAKSLKKPDNDGGYNPNFLGSKNKIPLPKCTGFIKKDLLKFEGHRYRMNYIHYTVVMSKKRKLAYYTAVNIDGTCWQDNVRSGSWNEDPRISLDQQLGDVLYNSKKSDFDRGHLVKREDPEWGEKKISEKAGINTFWYPNCAPQHKKLNQEIWKDLEANILHTGADANDLRVSVFSGPVLSDTDGTFVTPVMGEEIRIPNLFWKVVVWLKKNNKAYAVGFIQSQEAFLMDDGIIKKPLPANIKMLCLLKDEEIFEHLVFKDGKTYQVRLEEIEKLTGLSFDWPNVIRPFKITKPVAITGNLRHVQDQPTGGQYIRLKTLARDKKTGDICIPRWNPKFELSGLVT